MISRHSVGLILTPSLQRHTLLRAKDSYYPVIRSVSYKMETNTTATNPRFIKGEVIMPARLTNGKNGDGIVMA